MHTTIIGVFLQISAVGFLLIRYSSGEENNSRREPHPVINKCCGLDQNYNPELEECEPSRTPLSSSTWTVPEGFSLQNREFLVSWNLQSPPKCTQKVQAFRVLFEGGTNEKSYFLDEYGKLLESTYNHDDDEFQLNHLPKHFCVDPTSDALIFQICPPLCNDKEPCLRKCCPVGEQLVSRENMSCVKISMPDQDGVKLPLYLSPNALPAEMVEPRFNSGYTALQNVCDAKVEIPLSLENESKQRPFKVLTNGSIVYFNFPDNAWKYFNTPSDYCYDRIRDHGEGCEFENEVIHFCVADDSQSEEVEELKEKKQSNDETGLLDIISKVTLVIAVLCLLATTCVHLLLVEKADPQTWIRFLYIVSEFIFLQLFVFMLSSWVNLKKTPEICKYLAIASHFFGLKTLTWFSIYHFDSWWMFKEPKLTQARRADVIRFFEYCLVAVGVPLLIVSVALGIDSRRERIPSESIEAGACRSDIDKYFESRDTIYPNAENYQEYDKCFLAKSAHLAFWFDPILIILFLNLVFFVGITSRVDRQSNWSERWQYSTIIKVFIIVTTTWCIDTMGWILEVDPSYHLEIVHHVEAMALFVIFVCMGDHFTNLRIKFMPVPEDENNFDHGDELDNM